MHDVLKLLPYFSTVLLVKGTGTDIGMFLAMAPYVTCSRKELTGVKVCRMCVHKYKEIAILNKFSI